MVRECAPPRSYELYSNGITKTIGACWTSAQAGKMQSRSPRVLATANGHIRCTLSLALHDELSCFEQLKPKKAYLGVLPCAGTSWPGVRASRI